MKIDADWALYLTARACSQYNLEVDEPDFLKGHF
jgi:hypothetical protein